MSRGLPSPIRIAEIACYRPELAGGGGPHELSGGRRFTDRSTTVVKITATDGREGFGEACTMGSAYLDGFPESVHATVRRLTPVVLAADPLAARPLARAMDLEVVGHLPGKSAIDIAMWDLRGQLLGVPVSTLLGGAAQEKLPTFAAVYVQSIDAAIQQTVALRAQGHRRWQVKVGNDPREDAKRVRAVLAELGEPRYFSCDANSGWTSSQALRFSTALDDVDLHLEQPCATIDECARIRAVCRHPLVLDEAIKEPADLLRALALGCVDAINLKPTRVGGLTKAAVMRDVAHAAGLPMTVDEPLGGRLATAAILQLAATVAPQLLIAVSCFEADPATSRPEAALDGRVALPSGPGLGVVPDQQWLGQPVFVVNGQSATG